MIIIVNVIISMYGVVVMFFDQSSVYIFCDRTRPGGGGVALLNQVSLKLLLKTWQLCERVEYLHFPTRTPLFAILGNALEGKLVGRINDICEEKSHVYCALN